MSKLVSIATAVPPHRYTQKELFTFADNVYSRNESDSRKLKFLYNHSAIEERYSVIKDFNEPREKRSFFPPSEDLEPFPSLESRMACFNEYATKLSVKCIEDCITGKINPEEITHLITVSCTGMSAPGLDLQIMNSMKLPSNITRTSVNFMGCYAAVHAIKIADAFCTQSKPANVIVVCTEFCTLHFQKEPIPDNITASLLFGDGCAAILIQDNKTGFKGINLQSFFSDVSFKGSQDMAWELSSKGFLMTLTGYVPELIKEDFNSLADKAFAAAGIQQSDITHWCIHPGGKKILESISHSLGLQDEDLTYSYEVLRDYGNMSSATILFVLKKILEELRSSKEKSSTIFAAAFGPGLTMETFIGTYD